MAWVPAAGCAELWSPCRSICRCQRRASRDCCSRRGPRLCSASWPCCTAPGTGCAGRWLEGLGRGRVCRAHVPWFQSLCDGRGRARVCGAHTMWGYSHIQGCRPCTGQVERLCLLESRAPMCEGLQSPCPGCVCAERRRAEPVHGGALLGGTGPVLVPRGCVLPELGLMQLCRCRHPRPGRRRCRCWPCCCSVDCPISPPSCLSACRSSSPSWLCLTLRGFRQPSWPTRACKRHWVPGLPACMVWPALACALHCHRLQRPQPSPMVPCPLQSSSPSRPCNSSKCLWVLGSVGHMLGDGVWGAL